MKKPHAQKPEMESNDPDKRGLDIPISNNQNSQKSCGIFVSSDTGGVSEKEPITKDQQTSVENECCETNGGNNSSYRQISERDSPEKITSNCEKAPDYDDGTHDIELAKSESVTRNGSISEGADSKESQSSKNESYQTVNLELQIKLKIDKVRDGDKDLLTAEYSNIDWKGVLDTKNDVKKVVALCCSLDPALIIVSESIPDAVGIQHPRIVISIPCDVGEAEMKLVSSALYNYFDLIADPTKDVTSLFEDQSEVKINEQIRETAKDFCARRGGRQLPCEIVISCDKFSEPIKCATKVAKLKHCIVPGDIFEIKGKADGFRPSKHKLEFLMVVPAKGNEGRTKFKDQSIGFDQREFQDRVIALPHGSEVVVTIDVQKFTRGKKIWLSLKKIKFIGDKAQT